jgi:CBS domain-containing protein
MKAQDLMTPFPHVVTGNESVSTVARLMRDLNVGIIPVVDDPAHMHLRGVVTDRDLTIRCMAERHDARCPVEQHMTMGRLDTVEPDDDVRRVADLMERDQVRRIFVTDRGRLVGVISQADLAMREGPVEPLLVEEVLERVSAPSVSM